VASFDALTLGYTMRPMGKKARNKRIVATAEVPAAASTPEIEPMAASRWPIVAIAAFLALVVFYIFFQLRSHQYVGYDDPIYVSENAHVKAGLTLDGARWAMTATDGGNWHPLTWLTYMLDAQLFGTQPGVQLLSNAVLHYLNSLLVFGFLFIATRRVWSSGFVATLFAVHPLHVESVAWAAERKDVLCSFFFLLAILLHCRYAQTRSRLLYVSVIVAFILGLMSKGMIITLPFVLLVVDFWPLQRWSQKEWQRLRPLVIEKIPLFLFIIPAAIITLKAQQQAGSVATAIPLLPRCANATIAYVAYLGKTFWPTDLAVFYPYRVIIAPSLAIMALLFLLAVTALVMRQSAVRPYLAAGWFWYLGILVPVIGIVQIGLQSMADRYTYLSLIGIFAALTWLAVDLIHSKILLGSTAAAVIAILAILANQQAGYWQDSVTLFTHAVAVTPANATAKGNLGAALNALGDSEGAAQVWREAIAENPDRPDLLRNLGWYELTNGRKKEAADLFRKSISLNPNARTYAELASAEGNLNEAIRRYQQAVAETPDSAELRNDFAATLALAGRDQQALEQYEAALRVSPGYYNAEMNVGAILTRTGRPAEAIDHFRAASRAHPNSFEPHVYLALLLAQTARNVDAIAEMQKAVAMDPTHANAAVQQATGGRFDAQTFIAGMQGQHSP
jgi:tetratricopeptide (TPR) repeat protein